MKKSIYLRTFTPEELIFDDEEIITILKFFYNSESQMREIDAMLIEHPARSYAQGLLVEGIDASYAMGFVDILSRAIFRKLALPNTAMKKVLKKLAKDFAVHWFKNAKSHDIKNVKIYNSVRNSIQGSYQGFLSDTVASNSNKRPIIMVDYDEARRKLRVA